jgi:uncharacterized protein YkwD
VAATGRHAYRGSAARRTLLTVAVLCLTVLALAVGFRSVIADRLPSADNIDPARAGAPPATSGSPTSAITPAPATSAPATSTATSTSPPRAQPVSSTDAAQALLNQINAWREDEGAAPLTMTSGLVASAHTHNLRMSAGCGMNHQCPDEASLGDRITAEGISWRAVAENIAWHSSVSSSGVLAAAQGLNTSMHAETPPDDGHRRNMLNDGYHRIGIDVIRDASGQVWVTQDFAN